MLLYSKNAAVLDALNGTSLDSAMLSSVSSGTSGAPMVTTSPSHVLGRTVAKERFSYVSTGTGT